MKKAAIDSIITGIVLAGFLGAIVWHQTVQNSGLSGQNKLPSPPDNWTVIKVSDGDTLVVRQMNGREMKVRLCGIDADETAKQRLPAQSVYADRAKDYLQQLVNQSDNEVTVTVVESDRYNRKVSEVWVNPGTDNEELVNGLLVLKGLARVYRKYAGNCFNFNALETAEKIAKQEKVGVWSDPNSIPPWEWRRQNKGN